MTSFDLCLLPDVTVSHDMAFVCVCIYLYVPYKVYDMMYMGCCGIPVDPESHGGPHTG